MTALLIQPQTASDCALQMVQAVLAKNEQTKTIAEDDSGPLAVASALSDFFEILSGIESQDVELQEDQLDDLGEYGLELLDRVSYQMRQLDIHEQRDNQARAYIVLAVWLARHDAELSNLTGTADGFALITNGFNAAGDLIEVCGLMDEVLQAASREHQADQDRGDPWRPWRVINLNMGIAATRSLDPKLMERTFDELGRRLPYDLPNFFADGLRRIATQNVPEDVSEVLNRYAEKWPIAAPH